MLGFRVGSISLSFFVGIVASDKCKVECKVCHYTPICVVVCNACILCIHSTTLGMYRAYIHLGVHDHLVSNSTCHESTKNSAIVMVASNFFWETTFSKLHHKVRTITFKGHHYKS